MVRAGRHVGESSRGRRLRLASRAWCLRPRRSRPRSASTRRNDKDGRTPITPWAAADAASPNTMTSVSAYARATQRETREDMSLPKRTEHTEHVREERPVAATGLRRTASRETRRERVCSGGRCARGEPIERRSTAGRVGRRIDSVFGRQTGSRGAAVRERGAERADRVADDAVMGLPIAPGGGRPAGRSVRRRAKRGTYQVVVCRMGNDERRQPGQQQQGC